MPKRKQQVKNRLKKSRNFGYKARGFRLSDEVYSDLRNGCVDYKDWDSYFKHLTGLDKNYKK